MRNPVTLAVQSSPDPRIEVVAYDPAALTPFAELLSRAEWADVASYAAIVTNRTDHSIDGFVLQWRPATGRPVTLQADRYARRGTPALIRAGMQALVTPTGYIVEDQVGTPILTSALTPRVVLDRLRTPAPVSLVMDSVLYPDGRVVGKDTFDVIGYIQGRHASARDIATRLAAVRGDRGSIARTLAAMKRELSDQPLASVDHRTRWMHQLTSWAGDAVSPLDEFASTAVPNLFRD